MARDSFYVVNHNEGWAVLLNGEVVTTADTQEEAANIASEIAKDHPPSQVLIQAEDGKWRAESTYGDDPFPPAG